MADIIDIALNLNAGIANRVPFKVVGDLPRLPIAEVETRYYVRLWVADRPGVLAQIAQALPQTSAYLLQEFVSRPNVLAPVLLDKAHYTEEELQNLRQKCERRK